MYVCLYVFIYVCMYACVCVCVRVCVCIYACMYIYMYIAASKRRDMSPQFLQCNCLEHVGPRGISSTASQSLNGALIEP